MRNLLRSITVLFGGLLFSLSETEASLHVHGVRHLDDYPSALEQAESRSGVYDSVNGEGTQEGDGVMRNARVVEAITVEVESPENMNKHAGGEHVKTTIKTTIFETASAGTYEMGHEQRTEVQMSFITTTVFETGPGITVTVMPEAQMITQIVTVTAPGATVTEAGTCSQNDLASSVWSTIPLISVSSSSVIAQSVITTASTTSGPAQATANGAPLSVGSSGQVVLGTGSLNSVGCCECQCPCDADSFPIITYASMANAPTPPTTLQTLGSPTTDSSVITASTAMSMATSEASPSPSIDTNATAVRSAITSMTSSPSPISSSSYIASTSSISSVTATIVSSSATVTSPPSQSTVPAQGPDVPFNINTLSLSSALVLGGLGAHTLPSP